MANHKIHRGILRPTVPNPEVVWGSAEKLAAHCGISRRAMTSVLNGTTQRTKTGFRRMTQEEVEKYYQPPKPPEVLPRKSPKTYNSKIHWKLTFFKDWKKGTPYPTEPERIYSGKPQDFVRFVNCNSGQVYRLLNTHEGNTEKFPLKSIKGWTIARVRRYDKPQVRKARKPKED